MVIKLETIEEKNYEKCIGLDVDDEQRVYIASNKDSLQEAKKTKMSQDLSSFTQMKILLALQCLPLMRQNLMIDIGFGVL